MSRLPQQPGERIQRQKLVRFKFDGRQVEAYEGDTIGSALYASGRRIFSRSFKYHRPRGLMCCAGQCPNCIVSVDGAPGARACTEQVREGMKVEHVNAVPSLEFDAMQATDLAGGKLTPPGFYYKTFIRPRKLWPVYEKVLRHAAGLGKLRKQQPEREWRTEYRRRHADVLVVGGGVAGLTAARAAAKLGADVVLVDEGPELGGKLLIDARRERIEPLVDEVREAGVEIIDRGSALGYFDGMVPVWQGDTLHQIRAKRHVFATGTIEQPLVFAGNDLPGVMLSDGARRLADLYAVSPGTRAVVATTSDRGLEAALALLRVGVELRAVADLRPTPGAPSEELRQLGVEVLAGHTIVEAKGRKAVAEAVLAPVQADRNGGPAPLERALECDLVVVSGGAIPASSLLLQAGAKTAYDEALGHFAVTETPDDVAGAGEVVGIGELDAAADSGELAGLDAAHALQFGDAKSKAAADKLRPRLEEVKRPDVAVAPAAVGGERGKCFACLCEDVTSKDIKLSIDEGYDSIELAKRYTTVTMGPCQGRMCQLPAIRVMAQHTGQQLGDVGTTTARPPWVSVPMGILGGRPFEPAKRSSIHARHRELGGNVKWAGDWRRAYDYGDPQAEALAVNRTAGLIDVSTLGKLLVRGPDAGEFLDRLYPNRFSNLAPGRIRYGVISSDAGRIVDDGTICRVDDETFYVTTTSSGAGAVEEWFSWWLADWRMRRRAHRSDSGPVGDQPGRTEGARDHGQGHRPGLLQRGVQVPRRQARPDRRRAVPDPADRIRRRSRLRDPLPGRPRRAPVGRAARRRPGVRDPAVRARAPADSAPAEDAHPRRPGHRLGVDAVRRRDALDRQARQGAGLHRQVGAGALRRAARLDVAGRVHDGQRLCAHRGRGNHRRRRHARRPGHQRPLLAGARPCDRDGLGAGGAGQRRASDHDLRRGPHDLGRGPDPSRSTTPTGRCCAHESGVPRAWTQPSTRSARSPMEPRREPPAPGFRIATAGTLRSATARPSRRASPARPPPAGATSRTWASSSFRARASPSASSSSSEPRPAATAPGGAR